MTVQDRLAPGKYKLTVDDYEALAATGAFGEMRTELIDGEIIVMAPEYRPHGFVRDELAYRLRRALEDLGSDLFAASGSVRLGGVSMPQPDIVLTREPRGKGPIPGASVALLVEVSSTTLNNDLGAKVQLYAQNGVAEYWVVDVAERVLLQMWSPSGDNYVERHQSRLGDQIASATIPGLTISTSGI